MVSYRLYSFFCFKYEYIEPSNYQFSLLIYLSLRILKQVDYLVSSHEHHIYLVEVKKQEEQILLFPKNYLTMTMMRKLILQRNVLNFVILQIKKIKKQQIHLLHHYHLMIYLKMIYVVMNRYNLNVDQILNYKYHVMKICTFLY